ncbi:MAG TPA: rhomboid family intramembrane serine protease, partial [Candidatus Deferrimicrobiaceae bacterium]
SEPSEPHPGEGGGAGVGKPIMLMHRVASKLGCPRCGESLSAIDFQATGVPVIFCPACRGFLVPKASAIKLDERFAFSRKHAAMYAAMGESMAHSMKRTLNLKYGAAPPELRTSQGVAFPVVVPLAADAPAPSSFPAATWTFLIIPVLLLLMSSVGGVACRLPASPGGLPSGTGIGSAPFWLLLAYPFLPGGLLSLATGVLFLFVLGRQVEERVGLMPFAVLYLLGAVVAGMAHMSAGRVGAPIALGSAGAVAAVIGAYLVFFPNVPIRMYGMGRIVSLPAYLFGCCWVVATLMGNPETSGGMGLLLRFANPTPLSLWGSLGGFLAGAMGAVGFRMHEESVSFTR